MAVDPGPGGALPCGTDPQELIEHLAAGAPTGHERACPHCRAAAAEFAPLLAARDRLAGEPVAAPPRLLDDVMRTVRADPRSRRVYRLPGEEAGTTRVRRRVAAALLRTAAEQVPGVRLVRVRELRQDADGVAVVVAAVLEAGAPIPETARALREAVRAAGRAGLGWEVAAVDIEVADVRGGPEG
ncbi:Asp23/Gls24 family envelope stress response protein [Streptomonospora nanhaiensis]|uniref:Asp23/Gls24 family envelope stress response protein n=1 Tax=Streptomonospora nanhaiensis TaxID=1323731 RepID=UPI001C384FA5|nr:Asp23/Gls24 family envelope stress response protein [Streptomonospora nanhaiensis]MBV2362658.1 Asp23/Gls24 family envelope stress response protein [Streptomonospora nanhaiensis]MBX9387293.1 Asp23/Gls24 family envelope stress response protein [Streptomonospora nanhaiensis]